MSISTRSKVEVVEIGGLGTSSGSGGFINLTIELAGATSANEACKEEKDDNEADDTDGREDPGNRSFISEETKT